MNGVKISPDRFRSMLKERGLTRQALARQIGSTGYQMWRLTSDRHTTSFRFLGKLVPLLGLDGVADIIADEQQGEHFILWYIATHKHPKSETKRKTA